MNVEESKDNMDELLKLSIEPKVGGTERNLFIHAIEALIDAKIAEAAERVDKTITFKGKLVSEMDEQEIAEMNAFIRTEMFSFPSVIK